MPANSFLKSIDIFAQPVESFATRRDKQTFERTYEISHGSKVGGTITLLWVAFIIYYLNEEVSNTLSGYYDQISTYDEEVASSHVQENKSFLPVVQIR